MTGNEEQAAIIRGRIEAFEFAARQFRTYASDNDTLHSRYGTKSKVDLARAEKRSQTFRDAADDLDGYAENQRVDLAALADAERVDAKASAQAGLLEALRKIAKRETAGGEKMTIACASNIAANAITKLRVS